MGRKKESLSSVAADGKGIAYQNVFNIHNELKKCKTDFPPPPIAEIYQNPYLTEGSTCIFAGRELEHVLVYTEKTQFFLNHFENISIDKIVILLNAPAFKGVSPYLERFWRQFDFVIDSGLTQIMGSNHLYEHCVKWYDDFCIQWGVIQNQMQTIRLEFNPNKCRFEPLVALFALLKKHAFESARVSRLDIAVDYGMYLNPLCWRCKNTMLETKYEYNNVLKTRYFGSPESDVQIRVYDKSFELKQKQNIELGFDFWRVEAQVKAVKGESFNLVDVDTIAGFNPFERLSFYDPYSFEPQGKGAYNLFIYCARHYGISKAASLIPDRRTKENYLEQLKKDSAKLPFNSPARIYQNCFKNVYVRLVNKLYDLFEKGQGFNKQIMGVS